MGYIVVNPNHKALAGLNVRSTVEDVEKALHSAGASAWQYAKDWEFERYVYKDIVTPEQFKLFVKSLNADRYAMEGHKQYDCQKTWQLKKVTFTKWFSPAAALALARRTCCSCHQVGCFALSDGYHREIARRIKK